MKVLVVGSGGREHALTWKISQSPLVDKIYCLPGNGGMAQLAECFDLDPLDIKSVADFAQEKKIDLTVVGPEAPLVEGIADEFEKRNLKIFGPKKRGAMMEGSKSFAKDLMNKYGVPTAKAVKFNRYEEALEYVKKSDFPLVVKADGLAGGKGAVVSFDLGTALQALEDCFIVKKFGKAGEVVNIEEYLEGEEVTILAFTDGESVLPLTPAQDYKRAFDNDEGLNTGGMGSYSPVPQLSQKAFQEIMEKIFYPTIEGMKKENLSYQGILYGGLILTKEGPKVLEYNCRFGDPESQAILPLLKSDLVEIMMAVIDGGLSDYQISFYPEKCITVVIASQGYPLSYQTGFPIEGLEEVSQIEGVQVFHAGTKLQNGKFVTAGGRALNISAIGSSFKEAREKAYQAVEKIYFQGMHYRKDIGLRVEKMEVSK